MPVTKIVADVNGGVTSPLTPEELIEYNNRVAEFEAQIPVRELEDAINILKQNETHDRLVEAILDINGGLAWLQSNRETIDTAASDLATLQASMQ